MTGPTGRTFAIKLTQQQYRIRFAYIWTKIKVGFNYLEFDSEENMNIFYSKSTHGFKYEYMGIDCKINEFTPEGFIWKKMLISNFDFATNQYNILKRLTDRHIPDWIFLSTCEKSGMPLFKHGGKYDPDVNMFMKELTNDGLIRKFKITEAMLKRVDAMSRL